MREKAFATFAQAVNYWQRTLELLDWEIEVSERFNIEGDAAGAQINLRRRFAEIYVSAEYLKTATTRDLYESACHEVLHIILMPTWELIQRHTTREGNPALWGEFEEMIEQAIDRLSRPLQAWYERVNIGAGKQGGKDKDGRLAAFERVEKVPAGAPGGAPVPGDDLLGGVHRGEPGF